jgi:predicted NAD/FAD-dependent oxidoreductase
MSNFRTAGIIGAGIAGLACARDLRSSGIRVTTLEKSRGVGGRMATRRTDSGGAFDHGAQYFTVRDPAFDSLVMRWREEGAAGLWPVRIVVLNQGLATDLHEPRERYVGIPGMNAIAKSLAAGLDVRTDVTAERIGRSDGVWLVEDTEGNRHGPFDLLISTAPPPQTARLFANRSAAIETALSNVTMDPCWAVLLQLRERVETPFDAAFVHDSPLTWIARNSSKPGRHASDCWTLHASPSWSRDRLEDSAESVAADLVAEFWRAIARPSQPHEFVTAHRWRYALPQDPLPERYLLDRNSNLGACGDWCGGPRVEGAFLSGKALAEAAIAMNASTA